MGLGSRTCRGRNGLGHTLISWYFQDCANSQVVPISSGIGSAELIESHAQVVSNFVAIVTLGNHILA